MSWLRLHRFGGWSIFYGTLSPERSQSQPFPRRTLICPPSPAPHAQHLWWVSGCPGFSRSSYCPPRCLLVPSSFLLRLSCGAVILAFEDIFMCTWLFKGFTWPRSSPLVFELDWGWGWVTHCLGLPTGVRFGAIASPATAPCFTSCTCRHLLSGFSDNAFPQSANICHLWLSAPAGHPGGVKRGGWSRANSVRPQRLPVSSLAASPRGIGARTTEGVSCFGEQPPLGPTERLELAQRRQNVG